MTKISVVVPCYEYNGRGAEALEYSFDILRWQSFEDFDVVISDHSLPENKDIENLCKKWSNELEIHYYRNNENRGNPSANFNYAMANAKGDYIKFLCQDDFLYENFSLEKTYDKLQQHPEKIWLASEYIHAIDERRNLKHIHRPKMNSQIFIYNTIGTPSCVTIKNLRHELPMFDHELSYAFDCDWYFRVSALFGDPVILNDITVVNYLWNESITSEITNTLINKENRYILKKYGFIN